LATCFDHYIVKEKNRTLTQGYKQRPSAMGVFLIRNTVNDRIFLASGQNLTGIMNRHKFDLLCGGHKNKQLQHDWNELGASKFAFEIVEQLEPPSSGHFDAKQELRAMEDLWLAELKPFGERGYNEPKLTRTQRLARISAKRLADSEKM
jgi:hypothetical protein